MALEVGIPEGESPFPLLGHEFSSESDLFYPESALCPSVVRIGRENRSRTLSWTPVRAWVCAARAGQEEYPNSRDLFECMPISTVTIPSSLHPCLLAYPRIGTVLKDLTSPTPTGALAVHEPTRCHVWRHAPSRPQIDRPH